MSRSQKVRVPAIWDDGEEVTVRCAVRFGTPRPMSFTPESSWVPGDEDDTIEILSVRSAAGHDITEVFEANLSKEDRADLEEKARCEAADVAEGERSAHDDFLVDHARDARFED